MGGGQAAASFDETPTFRVPLSVSTSSPALFGATQPPSPSTPPQLDGSQTQDAAVEAVVRQIDTDNSGSSAPTVLSAAGAEGAIEALESLEAAGGASQLGVGGDIAEEAEAEEAEEWGAMETNPPEPEPEPEPIKLSQAP